MPYKEVVVVDIRDVLRRIQDGHSIKAIAKEQDETEKLYESIKSDLLKGISKNLK